MQPNPQPPKSLSQIVEEFRDDITLAELEDILSTVRQLKKWTGYGRIEIFYIDKGLDTINIFSTRKPKARKSV